MEINNLSNVTAATITWPEVDGDRVTRIVKLELQPSSYGQVFDLVDISLTWVDGDWIPDSEPYDKIQLNAESMDQLCEWWKDQKKKRNKE